MWASLQAPLFFGLVAACVASLGLLAVASHASWTERNAGRLSLVAAGMLISLSLLHIVPEALASTERAPSLLLTGFLAGLLLTYGVRALFPSIGTATGSPAEAIAPIAAIATHSLIDGVIYSVTFAASFESGVYAALGLIIHEFPEGIIAFAILRRHGIRSRPAFLIAFAAAAATTPLGAALASPILYQFGETGIAMLYAVSAGLLLYVATGPLMAPIKEEIAARSLPALAVGIAFAVALVLAPIPGHSHEGEHDHAHTPRFN